MFVVISGRPGDTPFFDIPPRSNNFWPSFGHGRVSRGARWRGGDAGGESDAAQAGVHAPRQEQRRFHQAEGPEGLHGGLGSRVHRARARGHGERVQQGGRDTRRRGRQKWRNRLQGLLHRHAAHAQGEPRGARQRSLQGVPRRLSLSLHPRPPLPLALAAASSLARTSAASTCALDARAF